MTDYVRAAVLARHDFYVAEVNGRVLSAFSDIETEAEQYTEAEYERLSRVVDPERWDSADVAEAARDRGIDHYLMLTNLRMQMWLGSLAGLYHQWDKELRAFVERELWHYYERTALASMVWGPGEVGTVLRILRDDFGWDCFQEPFYPDLAACGLIVNVHKHGKGRSLRLLAEQHPEFLRRPYEGMPKWGPELLEHEWLEISAEQFGRVANSLRSFWTAFPELLDLLGA